MVSYSSCNGISVFIYRGDLLNRELVGNKRPVDDVEEFVEIDDEEEEEIVNTSTDAIEGE